MAHQPTPVGISNDDYSIEISCLQEYSFVEGKSKPYTRFPHQVSFRFLVLVSSSNDPVTYQSTMEQVPSNELFSPSVFNKILKIVPIPFTLGDKNINWIGMHEASDCQGDPVGVDVDFKLLVNLRELVSEVVGYVKKTRDNHLLPLETMCIELRIKKIVAQPASVDVATWENWLENTYLELMHKKLA